MARPGDLPVVPKTGGESEAARQRRLWTQPHLLQLPQRGLGAWPVQQAPQANSRIQPLCRPLGQAEGKTTKQKAWILLCNGGLNLRVSLFRYFLLSWGPFHSHPQALVAAGHDALSLRWTVTSPERSSSSGSSQGHEEGRCLLIGS